MSNEKVLIIRLVARFINKTENSYYLQYSYCRYFSCIYQSCYIKWVTDFINHMNDLVNINVKLDLKGATCVGASNLAAKSDVF